MKKPETRVDVAQAGQPQVGGKRKTPGATTLRRLMFVTLLPREDYIAGNSVFEEFAVFLHLLQAVLHIGEIPIIVIGRTEEEAALRRQEFVSKVVVFQHLLASVDEVIHIFGGNESEPLVVHRADSLIKVVEDEVDLAEIRIIFLVSHFDLLLDFLLQHRQVKDTLCVGVYLEVVVFSTKAKYLSL